MKSTASPPESAPPPTPRLRSTRSNSNSSSSSLFSTPSPSRQNYILSPSHSSSSSIPFSWEQTPGIPKTVPKTLRPHPNPNPNLPLPPPLRSDSFTRNIAAAAADPFAVALVECAKDPPPEASHLWILNRPPAIKTRRWSAGDRFGFGSCKTSCSVADSAIEIPSVSQRVGSYRVVHRRVG